MHLKGLTFVLFILSACSNNSSNDGTGTPTVPTGPTPVEFEALGEAYSDVYTATRGLTLSSSLPSGPATYEGVMYVVDDFGVSTTGILGNLTVEVNFDSPSLLGTGTGFYSGDMDSEGNISGEGTAVLGEVTFTSSTLSPSFKAPLAGTLEVDGDGVEHTITAGEVELFFLDNPTTAIRGGSDPVTFDGTSTQRSIIVYAD